MTVGDGWWLTESRLRTVYNWVDDGYVFYFFELSLIIAKQYG